MTDVVETPAGEVPVACLLYTSDAADDLLCVDLGGRRSIKQKKKKKKINTSQTRYTNTLLIHSLPPL